MRAELPTFGVLYFVVLRLQKQRGVWVVYEVCWAKALREEVSQGVGASLECKRHGILQAQVITSLRQDYEKIRTQHASATCRNHAGAGFKRPVARHKGLLNVKVRCRHTARLTHSDICLFRRWRCMTACPAKASFPDPPRSTAR